MDGKNIDKKVVKDAFGSLHVYDNMDFSLVDPDLISFIRRRGSVRLVNGYLCGIDMGYINNKMTYKGLSTSKKNVVLQEIMRVPNIGKKSINEFLKIISEYAALKNDNCTESRIPSIGGENLDSEDGGFIQSTKNIESRLKEIVKNKSTKNPLCEFMQESLDDRSRLIFINRIAPSKKKTLEELAGILDITRERVRQVEGVIKNLIHWEFKKILSNDDLISVIGKSYSSLFVSDFVLKKEVGGAAKKCGMDIQLANKFEGVIEGVMDHLFFKFDKCGKDIAGWFKTKESLVEAENYSEKCCFDGNIESLFRDRIPISLTKLSTEYFIPLVIVEAAVNNSDRYKILTVGTRKYIHKKRVSQEDKMEIILKMMGSPIHFSVAAKKYNYFFNENISERSVHAVLGRMKSVTITGRGEYALYSALSISEPVRNTIGDICFEYIQESNKYISAKILYNKLSSEILSNTGNINSFSYFIVLGVIQDDDRFIVRRGYMIGIRSSAFTAKFILLKDEIIALFQKHQRPLSVYFMIEALSETRDLQETSLISYLDEDDYFYNIGDYEYMPKTMVAEYFDQM